jgi:hypothetical protein
MSHWLRTSITTIGSTPNLLVVPLIMVCFWVAAADVYAAANMRPHHSETPAIVLAGVDFLFSCSLFFGLAKFNQQLRELRLPKRPQVLAAALALIVGPILLVPCALVWLSNGGTRDVLIIAMGSVAGMPAAFLGRLGFPTRQGTGVRCKVTPMAPPVPVRLPNWVVVRMALGPPYSPASWTRRLIQVAAVGAALSAAPILVHLFGGSPKTGFFNGALHAAEFVGFLPAVAMCWAWPLTRLVGIFAPQSAAQTELALLPGLGDGRQQLRRLCGVGLGIPAGGLVALLALAMSLVALEQRPHVIYMKLALEFILIPQFTLPILIGQIVKPRRLAAWRLTALITSQSLAFTFLLWMPIWDAPDSGLAHQLRWLTVALVLAGLTIIVGYSIYSLRKFLQRPHPFVEISS